MSENKMTILCLACYFKGVDFIRQAKDQGCRVILVTTEKFKDKPWPREAIDHFFYMPGDSDTLKMEDLIKGVGFLSRTEKIDRIVPLDDFDLEKAAELREFFRIPGMGSTQTHFFRDKLAMRMGAEEGEVPVPRFVHLLNHDRIREFTEQVPPPWMCKPRSEAAAIGIKKIESVESLWEVVHQLGDNAPKYVLEEFLSGQIFHVDSIVFDGEVVFARAHEYLDPPFQVAHGGGIFSTQNVEYGTTDEIKLQEINRRLLKALGHQRGVSHSEYVKADKDGRFHFIETSARVGGANIAEMLEFSSGINLWREWARIETLKPGERYEPPRPRDDYSGIIISLARQEHPDTSGYGDSEIVWRLDKPWHVGLIVKAGSWEKVRGRLRDYTTRFYNDFHAAQPMGDKPSG